MNKFLEEISKLGVCAICLSHNKDMTITTISNNLKVILNLQDSLTACWQCNCILKSMEKFCLQVENSKNILTTLWSQCHSNVAAENVERLNSHRLSKSSLITISLGEAKEIITPVVDFNVNLKIIKTTDNYLMEIENVETNYCIENKNAILYVEYDSDESGDETLADIKRVIKREISDKEDNIDVESDVDIVKMKKKKNSKFKKVLISENEMSAGREEERASRWYVQAPYSCESCIIGYYNQEHLISHNKIKHNPEHAYSCRVCSQRIKQLTLLKHHERNHYLSLECLLCGERKRTYREMWRHRFTSHETDIQFPCKECDKVFMTRTSLVYHRRCDHSERATCEQCGKGFRNQTTYKRHLLIHTGMPVYKCSICGKSYRGKFGHRTHMKTHGPPPKDAYCVECDIQFKHGFQYRRHLKVSIKHLNRDIMSKRNIEKRSCDYCQKEFSSEVTMRRHIERVHLRLNRHNCQQCDKSYATPAALWTHRRTHHDLKPLTKEKVCELCGKSFRNNSTLVDHLRCHTGERPYSCDICSAKFRHNSGLYMHKKLVHPRTQEYAQVDADKMVYRKGIRSDLPLRCDICPASFRHSSGLYVHTRIKHQQRTKTIKLQKDKHFKK